MSNEVLDALLKGCTSAQIRCGFRTVMVCSATESFGLFSARLRINFCKSSQIYAFLAQPVGV